MAYFNLTQLGVQDPIKSVLKSNLEEQSSNSSLQNLKDEDQEPSPTAKSETISKLSPVATSDFKSYAKYTEKLTRHQRTEYDPNEIYENPITSSQEYGWWKQDGAPDSIPWTKVQRSTRVNSEMTRFVDEMTLTNKHFTLF